MDTETLTLVICKGTIPGTTTLCKSELLLTDGVGFYISAGGVLFHLELDPPRVVCSNCGYKTRLRHGSKVDAKGK